jgi:hypothetical protein
MVGYGLGEGDVAPQRREALPERDLRAGRGEARREGAGAPGVRLPVAHVLRDRLDPTVAREDGRGRLGPPSGDAGDAVGRVADEGQPVGDRRGRDPPLRDDSGLVVDPVSQAVPKDDPRAAHALGQVLVGGAEDDLLDRGVVGGAPGHGRERVVGLELDHRPRDDAQGPRRPLGERELREEFRGNSLRRLVAREEVVSERLDDGVERGPDVRDPGRAQEAQEAAAERLRRPHLKARRRLRGGRPEEGPEQLEGAVDQVDAQERASGGTGERRPRDLPSPVGRRGVR